jgi:hypothetical protein
MLTTKADIKFPNAVLSTISIQRLVSLVVKVDDILFPTLSMVLAAQKTPSGRMTSLSEGQQGRGHSEVAIVVVDGTTLICVAARQRSESPPQSLWVTISLK